MKLFYLNKQKCRNFLLCLALLAFATNNFAQQNTQSVYGKNFMLSTANPLATKAGFDVLKQGGTAVDAAVVVQLMLNLVEPESSGIGGGAFMLYWDAKKQKLTSFDGREKAPLAADENYWLKQNGKPMKWWDAVVGGRSVGVPGTLKLLTHTHQRYGKKSWKSLLTPVIKQAEQGFRITPRLAAAIKLAQQKSLDLFPASKDYFFDKNAKPLPANTLLKNPEFAKTLRLIANNSNAFYQGKIAKDIIKAVKTSINPGILSQKDLAVYQVIERTPICTQYRLYQVCGMAPPTSGGLTIAQILGILSHFNIPDMPPDADSWHLFAEAAKLAYADRAMYMADSDYVRMPIKGLIDPNYLSQRAQLIRFNKAMTTANAGNPPWNHKENWSKDTNNERPGTSHFVIVDKYGNMVSMTSSIETGFGSRVMVGGFLLNNELTDFSLYPEKNGTKVANRVESGKRPRSSMSPTMVFKDNKPYLLTGSPGGARIINYVAQSIVAVLDWNMDPQKAINLGHISNTNGVTELEKNTKIALLKTDLENKGHKIALKNLNSGLHLIVIKDKRLIGAADPRRDGLVLAD